MKVGQCLRRSQPSPRGLDDGRLCIPGSWDAASVRQVSVPNGIAEAIFSRGKCRRTVCRVVAVVIKRADVVGVLALLAVQIVLPQEDDLPVPVLYLPNSQPACPRMATAHFIIDALRGLRVLCRKRSCGAGRRQNYPVVGFGRGVFCWGSDVSFLSSTSTFVEDKRPNTRFEQAVVKWLMEMRVADLPPVEEELLTVVVLVSQEPGQVFVDPRLPVLVVQGAAPGPALRCSRSCRRRRKVAALGGSPHGDGGRQ